MSTFPHLDAPADGYVFIVTYGRSGSTLLQNLLNSIDGYCIRGENNDILRPLMHSWRLMTESTNIRRLRRSGESKVQSHPWYGAELMEPEAYGRALADAFVREVMHLPEGVRVAGFKEIRMHNVPEEFDAYLDFILAVFPRARFLFNTRDHAAVAKSGWWLKYQSLRQIRKTLTRTDAMYHAFAARHPDRCLVVHYDDYNGQPEKMQPVFDFLGETWDPALAHTVFNQRLDHLKPKGEPTKPASWKDRVPLGVKRTLRGLR